MGHYKNSIRLSGCGFPNDMQKKERLQICHVFIMVKHTSSDNVAWFITIHAYIDHPPCYIDTNACRCKPPTMRYKWALRRPCCTTVTAQSPVSVHSVPSHNTLLCPPTRPRHWYNIHSLNWNNSEYRIQYKFIIISVEHIWIYPLYT